MIKSYRITGMTCNNCAEVVHNRLSRIKEIKKVNVDLLKKQADIETNVQIPIEKLQEALADTLYEISGEIFVSDEQMLPKIPKEIMEYKKELVANYIIASGQNDYKQLLKYLHPDFQFQGDIIKNTAKEYIKMLKEHSAAVVSKNKIRAIFVDGEEACVIYDLVTNRPVEPIPFVEWINIKQEKIISTKVKYNHYYMKQLIKQIRKEQGKLKSNSN